MPDPSRDLLARVLVERADAIDALRTARSDLSSWAGVRRDELADFEPGQMLDAIHEALKTLDEALAEDRIGIGYDDG